MSNLNPKKPKKKIGEERQNFQTKICLGEGKIPPHLEQTAVELHEYFLKFLPIILKQIILFLILEVRNFFFLRTTFFQRESKERCLAMEKALEDKLKEVEESERKLVSLVANLLCCFYCNINTIFLYIFSGFYVTFCFLLQFVKELDRVPKKDEQCGYYGFLRIIEALSEWI